MDFSASSVRGITDEKIERLRSRIGIPVIRGASRGAKPLPASEEAIRRYAHGYGEINPLWTDPDYAASGPWGTVIGPPPYVLSTPMEIDLSDEDRQATKGDPLAGISDYMSGEEWEAWAPIRPGDLPRQMNFLAGVEEKQSEFAGRSVLSWHGELLVDDQGTPLRMTRRLMVYADRGESSSRGKYKDIQRAEYDEEALNSIDEVYASEEMRGATPRLWSEVSVGDEVSPIVRGPFLTVDLIAWHMGTLSEGRFGGVLAARRAYMNRQRLPRFYTRNEFGAWDSAQRCHWEDHWAQQVGQPFAYDYGQLRDCWVMNAVTNWSGDKSWLWKYRSAIRRFNYIGDTTWIRGTVATKYRLDDGPGAVGVELVGTNQRGEDTIVAFADVVLPDAVEGQLVLPSPPALAGSDPRSLMEPFLMR